eukprot:130876-Pleurochrysis_carterae.AAC.3
MGGCPHTCAVKDAWTCFKHVLKQGLASRGGGGAKVGACADDVQVLVPQVQCARACVTESAWKTDARRTSMERP